MSNIVENKLNVVLNPAEMAQIVNSITHIMDAIPDTNLTPEQRATMLSMNVDNKIFAEDCAMELGISGAGIIPPFINAVNLQNDITLFEQMDNVEAQLLNAVQAVSDAKRIAAHEAMTAANAIYKMYEMANFAGIANAKQGYDKLKERFKNNGGGGNAGQADV